MASAELQSDFDSIGLRMVVPWSPTDNLQDDSLESREEMVQILKAKVRNSSKLQ